MEKLTETTVVEVGKYYLVPCAKQSNNGAVWFTPVIGPEHADKQFVFTKKHYHIDGRFSGPEQGVNENGRTNLIICTETDKMEWPLNIRKFEGIEWKRRKCKRLTTGIIIGGTPPLYKEWYKSYVGKSCAGKRCPHLGTQMHEAPGGKLVCPLHNLIADKETEIIINYIPNQI